MLDECTKKVLDRHNVKHQIIQKNQGGFKQKEVTIENASIVQSIFHYNK